MRDELIDDAEQMAIIVARLNDLADEIDECRAFNVSREAQRRPYLSHGAGVLRFSELKR